jgi:putative colanic acid biosynthesis acetyltransferase WcaF
MEGTRKKVQLGSYDNSWYSPHARKLKIFFWYFTNVLFLKNPLNSFSSVRVFMLRLFGAKVGVDVTIKPSVSVKYPWLLEIGDNCWIGEDVWIDNLVQIRIGNNCCISQGAMLLTGNHNYKKTSFDLMVGQIILEEGTWIGAKSIVTQGITCGSHSVLSAGSVASHDLEPYNVYRGNPAEVVKERIIN